MSGSPGLDQTETDYSCVVKFENGNYHLSIEELGIRVIKEDLASGYEELIRKKNLLIQENEESELFIRLPPPRNFSNHSNSYLGKELKLFLMKTIITGTLIIAIIFLGAKQIDELARSALDRSSHLIVASLDEVFDRTVDSISASISASIDKANDKVKERTVFKAVTKGVPPEQKEAIIQRIRRIVERNKPFVDELKLLFINGSLPPNDSQDSSQKEQ